MISHKKTFYLFLGALILLTALAQYNLSLQPSLPFSPKKVTGGMSMDNTLIGSAKKTSQNPLIIDIDGIPVTSKYDLEAIIDIKKIGEKVTINLSDNSTLEYYLIPRNDFWFVFINGLLGFSFFVVAVLVWEKRNKNYEKYFSYTGLMFGFNLAMSRSGMYLPLLASIVLIIAFYMSYSLALLSFLYFSFHFPSSTFSEKSTRIIKRVFLVIGLVFALILIMLFFYKTFRISPGSISLYHSVYRLFRAFIFFTLFFSMRNIIRNHIRKPNPVNRRKLQWVLWGIFWGSFSFIFLWDIPLIFNLHPFVPEWLIYLSMLIIPISIAIAMLKYRLFDIEIVLSRSLIYSSIVIILVGVYVFSVGGLSLLVFK